MKLTIRQLRNLIREALDSKLAPHKKNDNVHVKAGDDVASKVDDDVYDMIVKSYEKIGGNATIGSKGDLGQYPDWFLSDVDEDPAPDVAILGTNKGGKTKMSALATDGSGPAKGKLNSMQKDMFSSNGWAEYSDALAHIAINKMGIPTVEDEETARRLLQGKEIEWHGEHPNDPEGRWKNAKGWYTRVIGGQPHTKIIVGNI